MPSGLIYVSQQLLICWYFPPQLSNVYRELHPVCQCLVDGRGQRRMVRLLWVDRKATVIQIITSYNQGMQKNISECTKQTGYGSYSICVKPAGTGNGKLRLLFTQAYRHWTIQGWKNICFESRIFAVSLRW